jgi:integrase
VSANKRWSFTAGERGVSRVRAYEDKRGGILVEFYEREPDQEKPRRIRLSLGHRDKRRARQSVNELVASFQHGETIVAENVTIRQLFDNYVEEVTPTKGNRKQQHDRLCSKMFKQCFGASRKVGALSRRDWDQFIRLRRAGKLGPTGRSVGNRQIEYDLKFLRAVINWALEAKVNGKLLLARDPFSKKSCKLPKEKNPKRPVMKEEEYLALLAEAGMVADSFRLALILAHETGHRESAIRKLRWSDVDFDAGTINWRAENEKTGYEHETPLSKRARDALLHARKGSAHIGDGWLFPSSRWPDKAMSKNLFDRWMKQAQERAGTRVLGWHSMRRKFVTERRHRPLKDLCALGGWKDYKTLLECYQLPDPEQLRESLEDRVPQAARAPNRQSNRQSGT